MGCHYTSGQKYIGAFGFDQKYKGAFGAFGVGRNKRMILDNWSIDGLKVYGSDRVSDNQCFIGYDITIRSEINKIT